MARVLRWSVDRVREQQGEEPRAIALTHPANWGHYKLDLLTQAVRQVDLDAALLLAEPVAAATYYASQRRLEPDSVVAVYDLGGGTFDAAAVRRTADSFEIIGSPEGIERLGGIDFDEAVFAHVRQAVGDALDRLDPEEPAAQAPCPGCARSASTPRRRCRPTPTCRSRCCCPASRPRCADPGRVRGP